MEMNTAYNVINRDLSEDDGPEATYEQVNERLLPKSEDYVQYPLESELVRSSASKPDSKKKKSGSKVKCSVSLTIAVVILLVAVLSAVSSITMAVLYHGKSESIMRDIAQLKSQQNQTQQVSLTPGVNNPTMLTNQLTSLTDTVRHLHEQFNNHSSTQISHELNKWIVETSSKITTLNKELNRTKRELEAQNAKLNTQAEIQLQIELSQAELNKTQKDSTSNISRLQVGMDVMHSQVNRALIHYQNCSKETEYCVLNADGNAELYWIQCETNRLPINTTGLYTLDTNCEYSISKYRGLETASLVTDHGRQYMHCRCFVANFQGEKNFYNLPSDYHAHCILTVTRCPLLT